MVKSGDGGLGESESEVLEVMQDLRDNGCTVLTIGQYLRPSPDQTPVVEYVKPESFREVFSTWEGNGICFCFFRTFCKKLLPCGGVFSGNLIIGLLFILYICYYIEVSEKESFPP